MRRRRRALVPAIVATLWCPCAQAAAQVTVRAATLDTLRLDGGGVVTIAFIVTNVGGDTIVGVPRLSLPRAWSAVMGTAPLTIAPRASETWLVSVAVPASTTAGAYTLAAGLEHRSEASLVAAPGDAAVVLVNERRALEILPLDVPGWVIAGGRYVARFLVRNRGNVRAAIILSGATSRGTRADAAPANATLAPGENLAVNVTVAIATTFLRSTDDVLELTATDRDDRRTVATASGRTTLIPRGTVNGDRYATIPATLAVRSIGGASGVSPVMFAGTGVLNDDRTRVTFSLQAPVGRQSPYGFGERDEYYAQVRGQRYAVRLGDNLFGFTPLTMSNTEASVCNTARLAW